MAMDPSSSTTPFQVEDVIEIVERRRWWLIGAVVTGIAIGVMAYVLLPAHYQAQTTILVEPQEVPSSFIQSTITLAVEHRLNTLKERVTSHANLNQLIDEIGAERLDPKATGDREWLMAKIRRGLEVDLFHRDARSAPVFTITFTHADPIVARDVVKDVADSFIQENIADRQKQSAETAAFLDKELDRLRDEVSAQEERIQQFRMAQMGSLPDQLESNLRALDSANSRLAMNLEAQEAAAQRLVLLRRQRGDADNDPLILSPPNEVAQALKGARAELVRAEALYTSEHPNVQALRAKVAHLEKELKEVERSPSREGMPVDPAIAALDQEVQEAAMTLERRRHQENELRDRIADLEKRVEGTPEREQELWALTRDYDNMMKTYRELLTKKYEASLARNLEYAQKGERFKVLRPPFVPAQPSFPRLTVTLPLGVGLALGCVCFFIVLSEFRNPAFRSVGRLTRAINLPVFASIPRIDSDQIYETPPSGDLDPKLVVYTAPESAPAEQYRGFLPIFIDAENCRVVLVTSAARGDGKSLTCMNLAISIATDLGKKVLVIDGDLRRPTAHRLMRIRRSNGLSSVLLGDEQLADCAVNSKIPNLSMLPAGRPVRNPLQLLTAPSFLATLDEAKKHFDVIFIDAPPLLPVVDSKILRKMADMVLFVVRADATPREGVIRSLQSIRDVAGVIFNQVSPGSFRRYYYYDAYSRYAYGDPIDVPSPYDEDKSEPPHV